MIEKLDLPEMKLPPGAVAGGRIPATAVLPGSTRTVKETFQAKAFPPGHYVISFSGHFGKTALDAQTDIAAASGG